MIYIISGTNRKESRSLEITKIVHSEFKSLNVESEIIDLSSIPLHLLFNINYGKELPSEIQSVIQKLNRSEGLYIVTPEYNGSMPGALKYFIDHFSYPETFEHRPVAFTGLGGRWGGMRPVEHLQQVFNYRNAYIFPERVFISNVWDVLKNGTLQDPNILTILKAQVLGFTKFIKSLQSQGLDAKSKITNK